MGQVLIPPPGGHDPEYTERLDREGRLLLLEMKLAVPALVLFLTALILLGR